MIDWRYVPYNYQRQHSTFGVVLPIEYEQRKTVFTRETANKPSTTSRKLGLYLRWKRRQDIIAAPVT